MAAALSASLMYFLWRDLRQSRREGQLKEGVLRAEGIMIQGL